ncbi:MAG: monofunctional biosynthetic peptidoglycan transglycosylase [Rhodothermales bacterium]|nr:monofunctional biosynthetic peptidoglycan transglycosylase [Rhodothermales bacterium]
MAGFLLVSVLWVILYRFAGPPFTFLVVRDTLAGLNVDRRPMRLEAISRHLAVAVVTAEDQRFCLHDGFDWEAIDKARDTNERGGRLRGASTVSMQTSKNAFLWPGRTWVRKGFEAYFTVLIETFWPKWRILEVYLNVAEWGDGLFGAEAAAQHYFNKTAAQLTRWESSLLAASLPSPLTSNPARPSAYLARRASQIRAQMNDVDEGFGACLEK